MNPDVGAPLPDVAGAGHRADLGFPFRRAAAFGLLSGW
jgi:hypothetical protein